MIARVGLTLLICGVVCGSAEAQGVARDRAAIRAQRRAAKEAQQPAMNPKRQQLEQQVRQRMYNVAKTRIGFSDDQMSKLVQTSEKFDQRRRTLAQQERAARVSLRSQLTADTAANQTTISSSLESLQSVQRQRLELQADEQKEFATFMTPLQRARYLALQEQVRKKVQDIVKTRADSAASPLPQ